MPLVGEVARGAVGDMGWGGMVWGGVGWCGGRYQVQTEFVAYEHVDSNMYFELTIFHQMGRACTISVLT